MKIKCSFNFQWIGKTETAYDEEERKIQTYQGKKVSLGHAWVNVEHDLETIFEAVTKEGIPIGPYLKAEANGNRKRETFESHQLAFVDVDNGMTLQELLRDDFYNQYGGGFYTSPSFTDEHHKFRVMFVLERPITDVEDMRHLYKGLMMKFNAADASCKDGARLFNGTVDARYRDLTGVVMPDSVVQQLITDSKKQDEEKYNNIVVRDYEEQSDEDKKRTVEQLKKVALGDYNKWKLVGWSMFHNGYSLNDFIEVTLGGMMNKKTAADCAAIWKDGQNYTVSFGYIVNLLKEHGVYEQKQIMTAKQQLLKMIGE